LGYTVINTESGRVIYSSHLDKDESVLSRLTSEESIIDEEAFHLPAYWDGVNFIPIGFPPGPFWEFNYTLKEWEDVTPLYVVRKDKWKLIKDERDVLESSGFEYKGVIFDSDANSQTKLLNFITMGLPVTWTLKDNSTIDLTVEDLNALKGVLANHITSLHERSRIAREKIEQATTKEEVMAVTL